MNWQPSAKTFASQRSYPIVHKQNQLSTMLGPKASDTYCELASYGESP